MIGGALLADRHGAAALASGYDKEPDYGGQPPLEPTRLWPMFLSIVLAAVVALILRDYI
jgi:hypothetical protein